MAKDTKLTNQEISIEKKAIINRINRIVGQLGGVKKMIEDDRACSDILIQMMAVSSSVKSTQRAIFENNFKNKLAKRVEKGDEKAYEELCNLLKRI